MKRFIFVLLFCWSFCCQAESLALNFNSIPLVQFAEATYRVMLKRDYVITPELLALQKPISVSVRNITIDALPKFVEGVLSSQGVNSVERNGIFYLSVDLAQSENSGAGRALPLSGSIRSRSVSMDDPHGESFHESGSDLVAAGLGVHGVDRVLGSALDDERRIFSPLNRKVDFVATVLNAVFSSKPAAIAGGVLVLSGSKDLIEKILEVARGVDMAPHKVKVSATFVEVSTTVSSGLGVSVIANLLGAKLGIKLGDASAGSLSLGGNSFQVVLDAIAADGRFRQVANPTALVDDYEKTNVSFGDSVPTIASTSLDKNGNPIQQITYQPSGVLLDVTPRVLGSGKINLTIDGQVSSFAATTSGVNSSPTLSKRQVQTSLTIDDSDILVIGGLNSNKAVNGASGFSFLPKSWSLKNESVANTDLVLILSASVVK